MAAFEEGSEEEVGEIEEAAEVVAEAQARVPVRASEVEMVAVVETEAGVWEEDPVAMTSWDRLVVVVVEAEVEEGDHCVGVVFHCCRDAEEAAVAYSNWALTWRSWILQSLLHYHGRRRRYDHYEGPAAVEFFPDSKHRIPPLL